MREGWGRRSDNTAERRERKPKREEREQKARGVEKTRDKEGKSLRKGARKKARTVKRRPIKRVN